METSPCSQPTACARGTPDFLWATELAIQDDRETIEIDICAIIKGRVVVGEAKCNGRLDSRGRSPQQAADRLIRVAQILAADEIVLATSEPSWAPGAIAAVQTALTSRWRSGPVPKTTYLTDLGN